MVEIKIELINLRDFEAWSGAKETQNLIIDNDKEEEFLQLIEELYPEGLSDTELNDILWFEEDWIKEQLNIKDDEEDL